jgi:MinD-like ATPase involved in chromosome partitioning or flagellar assembly
MALANVAVQIARKGRDVLMVDWDLEAPGLDRYFLTLDARKHSKITIQAAIDRTGLMGLLHEAFTRGDAAPKREVWQPKTIRVGYPRTDSTSDSETLRAPGRLDLLPSGHGSEDYAEKQASFSWSGFFADARGGEWLEGLRDQWAAEYDFIFIDSRTGLTDSGGVCTIQMPDILVLVFTANDQSLEGGLKVVAAAQRARSVFGYDRGPLSVVPILSRWEGENEVDIGDHWMQRFDKELVPLTASWLPKEFSPRQFESFLKVVLKL